MWANHSRFSGHHQCTILHPPCGPQDITPGYHGPGGGGEGICTECQGQEELLFERERMRRRTGKTEEKTTLCEG